jgi:hypothetical protein
MNPSATPAPSLPDRFTSLVEGLMSDVAACVVWASLPIPYIKLVWRRLRHLKVRFHSILDRYEAGTLPTPACLREAEAASLRRRQGSGAGRTGTARPPAPLPLIEWTQRFGWVSRSISRAFLRSWDLEEILEDPEMEPAVEAAPQLGRVLRPLCQMLGVRQPAWLRRPRRPRRRVPKQHPPAPEWLVNEPGAILRPDGTVWMHLGSSTHWKPGSGRTLEEARKIDPPRRIWPRQD